MSLSEPADKLFISNKHQQVNKEIYSDIFVDQIKLPNLYRVRFKAKILHSKSEKYTYSFKYKL